MFNGEYDLEKSHLTLKESAVEITQAKLALTGSVDAKDSLLLDLEIEGKKKDFSLLFVNFVYFTEFDKFG